MLYNSLYKVQNFVPLVLEVKKIISQYGDGLDQMVCQTLPGNEGNWVIGSGRASELEIKDEKLYNQIQPALKGGELEKLIIKHNAFRTRIMRMKPKTVYSGHADPTPRIHVPIVTNFNCAMIWSDRTSSYVEAVNLLPGFAYWTDTTKHHTAANFDENIERIHIVMCVDQ